MSINNAISVIGGDSRQLYAAEYLKNSGYEVSVYGCEHGKIPSGCHQADSLHNAFIPSIILLPLPVTKNGRHINTPLSSHEISIKDIQESLTEAHTVFLGMGQPGTIRLFQAKAGLLCDYFTIEAFTYKNALLTAEGIMSIILDKLPVTVFGLKTAITGYGRIGCFISEMLKKLGAVTEVYARNSLQLARAELNGHKTRHISEISEHIGEYDCIINTVPHCVIDEEAIKKARYDCVFIESASAPYGIDAAACARHEKSLIKAFSLPGKTAPKTAGIIIGETVIDILKEGEKTE